jgi:transposase
MILQVGRGERYGTILIDLEKRQPIDLLPNREAGTLEKWLAEQPQVEVISRDRGGAYASGARVGAPQAEQVADRFHLLKNLLDGFEKFLSRRHDALKSAFGTAVQPSSPGNHCSDTSAKQLISDQKAAKQEAQEHRFQQIKQLRAAGVPILQLARRLKMSRNTVKKFLAAAVVPPLRCGYHQRYSPIHAHVPYLRERWIKDKERSSRTLWKEIKEQGYSGAEVTLRHYLQKWRGLSDAEIQARYNKKSAGGRAPSPRQVKWLLFCSEKSRQNHQPEEWQRAFLEQLRRQHPEIAVAEKLVFEFHQILSKHQPEALPPWLEKARASGIGELVWFANGVEQDRAAVEAACSSRWSQGQVEGQVNRLKFLKRQMYGRAKFDLLRARVLYQF